ncbi:cytochrome O ubiquinol oxidase [Afipia sp. P52-10]|jgi:cytochrome o ubiquinol oxidase operon protein cyoD|uniref:cytochrome o ubiquinol oxidase subunit IV n=1 Tax=Afipia sp. P52-10 TaxID=1429916 RepID=UPI0003DF1097|nr:cytochrome o ubiquinol oxidase subunit IV [Afipia sp. P52-10]ETR78762.1 cytochrome O ubiquinol oxidase [Afipia sp. P52-10]
MNTDAHANHDHNDHGDDHAHGSLRSYMIGFWLSVVLTAIPFYLVMSGAIDNKQVTSFVIIVFAALQIIVHMVCFLHMDAKSESGWTLMALVFTVIIVGITLAGSLWVMYHLNVNMMPGHDMSRMP